MRTIFKAAVFILSAALFAGAQTTPPPAQAKVFDFANMPSPQALQEMLTILRTVGDIQKVAGNPDTRTLNVAGTTEQLAMTGWMVQQLDQPMTAASAGSVSPQPYLVPGTSDDEIRIFHLANAAAKSPQAMQEMLTVLRTVVDVQKVFNYTPLSDLVVRASAARMAFVQYLIDALDITPEAAASAVSPTAEFSYEEPRTSPTVARVFYLKHAETPQAIQEMLTVLRTVLDVQKVFNFTAANALAVRGSAPVLAAAQFVIQSLDVPAAPGTGAMPNVHDYQMGADGRVAGTSVQVYYLAGSPTPASVQQMLSEIRGTLGIQKTFTYTKPGAIVVRGSGDQIAKADQLIQQANKPVQTVSAH